MRPMSRHFAEIHGVDVSDEMIALARERLLDIPNAHLHVSDGASLAQFPDETFDFVYSYAVFQHVPSREVISAYMRETHRVLKMGGLARLQFNGMPARETLRIPGRARASRRARSLNSPNCTISSYWR